MDVIVGHLNHDFDCVGSMIGAKKLHPSANIFLQPSAEGTVLEFINLYRDHFSFFRLNQLREDEVESLIIVDTNSSSRLGPYEKLLGLAERIVVYDHHPPERGDIDADEYYFDSVGALVTLMAEKIREAEIELTSYDATALLLGLHQETGGLQFGNTGVRDYAAGHYMMEKGADLDVVQNFCSRKLTGEQLDLYNDLLSDLRNISINEVPVTVATAKRDSYLPQVATIAHKIRDSHNTNFLCLIVQMGEKIQVVFRNRYDQVDVGLIAAQFGGGGHSRAASATLSGVTLEEAENAILDTLKNQLKPKLTAREIMSSPVHSVRPELSIQEAQKVMLRLGHHGLPVTDEENTLIGIVTRTDVDKAMKHELTHAPVKGFMNPEVVTVEPDTGLQQLQEILTNEQIGRLPVVEDGNLIGIVTRTDIIKVLHRQKRSGDEWILAESPSYSIPSEPDDIEPILRETLDDKWVRRFRGWGELADELDETLFLVGGCVRDILLEEQTRDFDFLVEGDAIEFAEKLAEKENAKISSHEKFKTSVVTLPDGTKIDLATARSEYYTHPAALPEIEIEHASVVQDLRRRDFTINAMAVNLLPDQFGELLDLYGGRNDLEQGLIRVLYAMSFLDDPTRVFRAIRFAGRLDFEIESRTEFQLKNSLEKGLFDRVSGDRLREELNLVFDEDDAWIIVDRLFEKDVLSTLHSGLERQAEMMRWFENAGELIEEYNPSDEYVIYYGLLFQPLNFAEAISLGRRLKFRKEQLEILETSLHFDDNKEALEQTDQRSEIYRILENIRHEETLLIQMALDTNVSDKLRLYIEELKDEEPLITGDDLREMGITPGPQMGEVLDSILDNQLDGKIENKEQARDFVFNNYGESLTN